MSDKNSAEAGREKAAGAHDAQPNNEFSEDVSDETLEEVSGGTVAITVVMSLDVCPGSPGEGKPGWGL